MNLQIFLQATKKISQNKVPLLHEVIPIVDIITRALDDYADDVTKLPVVRAAAQRGRAMVNKYYSLTDDSIMYRLAMRKFLLLLLLHLIDEFFCSASPSVQDILLHQSAVAKGVDYNSRKSSPRSVGEPLSASRHCCNYIIACTWSFVFFLI
jgi:hypothetical protein